MYSDIANSIIFIMTLVPEHHLKLPQTNGLLKHLE
jgi:hypothetical protein